MAKSFLQGLLFFFVMMMFAGAARALGAEPTPAPSPTPGPSDDTVDVESIKQKYWAGGNPAEMGVVQNRLYSKEHKFELMAFGGVTISDPFLTVETVGLDLGYHFTEIFSAHLLGWKSFVQPSSALTTFQQTIGATTNNNPPQYYVGGEGAASVLYGKLSLVGKAIIYYDFHFLLGMGATGTDNGVFATPSIGVGQRIYAAKFFAVRVDYRLMLYNETILEKVIPTKLGQVVGQRLNWSNAITIGADFFLGGK
ncbi:MAG: outer membrane beta-barrel domain-containing protein [Bdellovibrionota bacterium]